MPPMSMSVKEPGHLSIRDDREGTWALIKRRRLEAAGGVGLSCSAAGRAVRLVMHFLIPLARRGPSGYWRQQLWNPGFLGNFY